MGSRAVTYNLLLVLICKFLSFSSSASRHWVYCGSKQRYTVLVNNVSLSPYPVKTGKPALFNISATSKNVILGGKIDIEAFLYSVYVHSESHSLCLETACPVEKGSFLLANTEGLPGNARAGFYKLRVKLSDENKMVLTCFYINIRVVSIDLISNS